jgi:hypothetical protein
MTDCACPLPQGARARNGAVERPHRFVVQVFLRNRVWRHLQGLWPAQGTKHGSQTDRETVNIVFDQWVDRIFTCEILLLRKGPGFPPAPSAVPKNQP